MAIPSLDATEANMPFGELVLARSRDHDGDALRRERDARWAQLPPLLLEHAWAWLPAVERDGLRAHCWRQRPEDAAARLLPLVTDAHEATHGVSLSGDEQESLFWGVVFHFARQVQLSTEARAFVQNAVGESRYRRPFES